MEAFTKHLYVILFPNEALVASELSPEDFGRHYAIGSPKHFSGKVIFAEIDLNFRHPYFPIDEFLAQTTTGKPGIPKKTKFIKSYRVLEHIDMDAFQQLYLVTVDGHVLGLQSSRDYTLFHQPYRIRIYQEICPLQLLVASNLSPQEFGRYITREATAKGAPKLFFTQYDVDVEAILNRGEDQPLLQSPLPNVNPTHFQNCLKELAAKPDKRTKTISLNSILDEVSYARIKHGFWLADGENFLYYPMLSESEIEEKHYEWWKSVYQPHKK